MTRDLNIRADIDSRGARQGARETNKAQDEIARKAREVGREQARQQSSLTQQLKAREREQKKLERSIDSLERKASLHGKRGVERIRAQEIALKAQARAAGATAEQIKRIGAAYDQMAAKAVAAQRKAQAGRGAGPATGGAGGGFALGALAARAGGVAAGAYAAYSVASSIGPLAERAGRLSDLPAALGQIANNSGVAESRLRAVVGQLYDLDFSMVQAQKSTAMFAQAGIPALLDKLQELAKGARNLSVVSGIAPSEALEGIGGAILKGELDLLETQGLVGIKFEEGYKRYAAAIGKSTAALTEQEKVVSRLQQVLDKLLSVQGVYERSLDTSGGALRELSVQGDRAYDALAKLLDPTITAGANALAGALASAAGALNSMQGWTASPDFKAYLAGLSALSNVSIGPLRPFAAVGAIPSAFGFQAPGEFVGPPTSLMTTVGPPRTLMNPRTAGGGGGTPGPQGFYNVSEFFKYGVAASAQRNRALGGVSQLNSALGSIPIQTGPSIGGAPAPANPWVMAGLLGFEQPQQGLHTGSKDIDAAQRAAEEWHRERQSQIKEEQRSIMRANEQVYRDLKFQSASLFQAMVGGGKSFWNFWKNAGLTAMSEVFSTGVANMLGGRGGGAAGLLSGAFGGFGGISRPGAPGGTSGFAGPVGSIGSTVTASGGGLLGRLGASSRFGAAGTAGLLALGATQLPGRGAAAGAVKGGLAGGLGFGGALAAFPALAGLLGVPGVNIGVGAAIGVGALVGKLTSGARGKARQKVREVYGVTIRDGGVLDQVVAAGRDFGSLAVAVQSPGIRDLVQLYAMSTGQDPRGGVTAQMASAVRLRQVGGLLFQDVQYSNGRPTAAPSALPLLGVGRNAAVNVVNLDAMATTAALENAAYRAIAGSGELVQAVGDRAMRQSAGRRMQAALLMEPMTAVGS